MQELAATSNHKEEVWCYARCHVAAQVSLVTSDTGREVPSTESTESMESTGQIETTAATCMKNLKSCRHFLTGAAFRAISSCKQEPGTDQASKKSKHIPLQWACRQCALQQAFGKTSWAANACGLPRSKGNPSKRKLSLLSLQREHACFCLAWCPSLFWHEESLAKDEGIKLLR